MGNPMETRGIDFVAFTLALLHPKQSGVTYWAALAIFVILMSTGNTHSHIEGPKTLFSDMRDLPLASSDIAARFQQDEWPWHMGRMKIERYPRICIRCKIKGTARRCNPTNLIGDPILTLSTAPRKRFPRQPLPSVEPHIIDIMSQLFMDATDFQPTSLVAMKRGNGLAVSTNVDVLATMLAGINLMILLAHNVGHTKSGIGLRQLAYTCRCVATKLRSSVKALEMPKARAQTLAFVDGKLEGDTGYRELTRELRQLRRVKICLGMKDRAAIDELYLHSSGEVLYLEDSRPALNSVQFEKGPMF
jgi:hypothetical protein